MTTAGQVRGAISERLREAGLEAVETYGDLCALLAPLGVYRLDEESLSGAELFAAGAGLDEAEGRLAYAERESVLMTAEGEGLTRRERLFSRIGTRATPELRRLAIASLALVGGDGFTLEAINRTISGCGVRAVAAETDKAGTVRVTFPQVAGEPEDFARIRDVILDIMPCHLLVDFYFRYLTWEECEAAEWTWQGVEGAERTWESFEKAVPTV